MRIVYVDWMDPAESLATRWTRIAIDELRSRGHSVDLYHLQREGDSGNVLVRRVVMIARLLKMLGILRAADVRMLMNPYCLAGAAVLIRYWCGPYVLDTTDSQDLPETIRLNKTRWYKRPVFLVHYFAWRVFIRLAYAVRTNNHKTLGIASSMGISRTLLLYDVITDCIECQTAPVEGQPIVGCICAEGTEHYMNDYLPAFARLQGKGVKFEVIGCSREFARASGAERIAWTLDAVSTLPKRWLCGLALLPRDARLDGKVSGKVLQYLAAGIPVLASPQGETIYMLRYNGGQPCIWFVEDAADVEKAIEFYAANRAIAHEAGSNGHAICKSAHSIKLQIGGLEQWFGSLTKCTRNCT